MSVIRFDIDEETKAALNSIKGDELRIAFARKFFKKAVMAEYKKQKKKEHTK